MREVRVVGLKVDYLESPLGLENTRPRLSWHLESDARNVMQSGYRILVASTPEALMEGRGDLWDSGKVDSRKSFGIPYEGRSLISRQRCYWNVQVWDESHQAAAFSASSWWEMGLLDPADWVARWLAVEDEVARADRETGLHWIWGSKVKDSRSRKFRLTFSIPTTCRQGLLLVGAQHIPSIPIPNALKDVWVDGMPAALESTVTGAGIAPPLSKIPLGRLAPGKHVFAANTQSIDSASTGRPHWLTAAGFVAFARLELENGEILRLAGDAQWKTSLTEEEHWQELAFADNSWENAKPVDRLAEAPWPATPAMHLRKPFEVQRQLKTARLYATALGAYEAYLNGKRVGDALLAPETAQFRKRVLYQTYDVTALLERGENVLALTVGDGWYASPLILGGRYPWGPPPRRVMAQLELVYTDGSTQIVASQPHWRLSNSPIVSSELYDGEVYDARLEQQGWNQVGFDDSGWLLAQEGTTPPCQLTAQVCPPIRRVHTFKPQSVRSPKPGVQVFDFGQNFAGWCRLRVRGEAGIRIELRHAEALLPGGEVDQTSLRAAKTPDVYILKGGAEEEVFEPHFTYHGFRYVQVTGLPRPPTDDTLEGIAIQSDLPITGTLRVGDPLIERIWRAIVWTQRSNFVSIPTDCPQRDERLGWMGDAGAFWDSAAFNMDVNAFTHKQMDNVRDDQIEDGALTYLAPEPTSWDEERLGPMPGYGDGSIILSWVTWQRYGDLRIIEDNWNTMDRYLDYVLRHNPDHLWRNQRGENLGDHFALEVVDRPNTLKATPKDVVSTAYWAHSAGLLAQMANAIGRTSDAQRLWALQERVRQAFNDAFVKPDGTVGEGTQADYIFALQFGLLSGKIKEAAAERLVTAIRERDVSLTTGILSTQFSLDVLASAGFPKLVYDLLLRTEFPSWGGMIGRGATTIWETWSGVMKDGDKIIPVSLNHFALGAICGFLFRRVAGIDAATPGFETILIHPVLDPRVRRGGGDYGSVMGRISTEWEQETGDKFRLEAVIPPNTHARIHLPARAGSRIEEGGRGVSGGDAIRIVSRSDFEVVIAVGSGRYLFTVSHS